MIYEKSEPPWRLAIQLILKFVNTPYLPNVILEPSSDISLSKKLDSGRYDSLKNSQRTAFLKGNSHQIFNILS